MTKIASKGYLHPEEIVRIWRKLEEEFGVASLGRVREYMHRKMILNPDTHKPPTRQGILSCLARTPEGRDIIRKASHARYLNRPPHGWPEERWAKNDKDR